MAGRRHATHTGRWRALKRHASALPLHTYPMESESYLAALRERPSGYSYRRRRWRAGASAEAKTPESTKICSRATTILLRAALAGIGATPGLLCHTPARHPVGE